MILKLVKSEIYKCLLLYHIFHIGILATFTLIIYVFDFYYFISNIFGTINS